MNCLIGDREQLISNDMLLCTAPSPSSIHNNRNNNQSGNLCFIFISNFRLILFKYIIIII